MPFQSIDLLKDASITIGEHTYPITHFASSTSEMIDQVAHFSRTWDERRGDIHFETYTDVELTPYGRAVIQEYLSNGQCCDVTINYGYSPVVASSRRPCPRNTRIQRVQAKRKALYLGHNGKCCSLRTRKASLALRKAEQRWYLDMSAEQPVASEYERVSPRVARKQASDARRFYRSFGPLKNDPNYLDLGEYFDREIAYAFTVPDHEIGETYNG
jgi:hypothetical protein